MKLSELAHALEASFISGEDRQNLNFDKVGAADLMSDILAALSEHGILLTGLATVQVVNTAVIAGVRAIVFVRNKQPDPGVIEMAKGHDMPMLTTQYSMFVSCGRLYSAGLTGLNGAR
jgi:predicted transcriptional regulator